MTTKLRSVTTKLFATLACLMIGPAAGNAGPIRMYVGPENPGSPYATIHAVGTRADGLQVMVGSVLFTGQLGTFDAYCVDINHYITPNRWYSVDVLDLMSNWGQADPLVRSSHSPADAGERASYLFNTFGGAADSMHRWALQVAIWNALYDDDSDVTTGAFSVVSGYAAGVGAANDMLQALGLYDGPPMDARWLRLADTPGYGTQDFITAVPEPASGLLLGGGLSALFVAWRLVGWHRRRPEKAPVRSVNTFH